MRIARRLLVVGAATLVGLAAAPAGPGTAQEDDEVVVEVAIEGDTLAEPVVARSDERPEVADALYREVDWLRGREGDARPPEDEDAEDLLGPGFTVVVSFDGEPRHRYQLYPLAEGGPRVYRPAEQPGDRTAAEAWFFGRLSMPETFSTAGVRLPGVPDRPVGGSGGGEEEADDRAAPGDVVMSEWQEGMRLTALVAVVLVLGLGAVALLVRRRV